MIQPHQDLTAQELMSDSCASSVLGPFASGSGLCSHVEGHSHGSYWTDLLCPHTSTLHGPVAALFWLPIAARLSCPCVGAHTTGDPHRPAPPTIHVHLLVFLVQQ